MVLSCLCGKDCLFLFEAISVTLMWSFDGIQGLSKKIKRTRPTDLKECLELAVNRLTFPGVSKCSVHSLAYVFTYYVIECSYFRLYLISMSVCMLCILGNPFISDPGSLPVILFL